ncbi:unnamed protein product [Dracunculus medinensis]|uniref:Integrase catalytic domain-containing protein n=1 Tax=Dracunculus medinensis TaxID=318479 RepID=A0A0N4U9J1_DRAME|nr:unnamed protein product [Dracunculus medinensis]
MAYATTIYTYREGMRKREPFLVYAKSHIVPIKGMTIARLKLLAVLIGVQTGRFVLNQLDLEENRVEEIRKAKLNFRYIPRNEKPVDVATRRLSPTNLKNSWWYGPSWLKKKECEQPQCEFQAKSTKSMKKWKTQWADVIIDTTNAQHSDSSNAKQKNKFEWLNPISDEFSYITMKKVDTARRIRQAQFDGLVNIKLEYGSGKRWIALFTCNQNDASRNSRESAETFLLIFRRFISRRGCPKLILSDSAI